MRNNEQFTVAIHILTYLANNPDEYVTSQEIARSVNTSSVVIRRIVAKLKTQNIVETKRGVGGSKLTRKPCDITLAEVYRAVDAVLEFKLHDNTNIDCEIGRKVNSTVQDILEDGYEAMEKVLLKSSIQDVLDKVNQ